MNILIINQPLNNRGDEAAHKALVRSLLDRLPNVNIKVLWVYSIQDSINQFSVKDNRVEYLNLSPGRGFRPCSVDVLKNNRYFLWHLHPTMRKILKIYNGADYVICAPGGICMGGFQSWGHLFYLKLAQYLNKPLIYYGRSFGPFPEITSDNRKFKKMSMDMLHYFSFLSIRDSKTEKLASELNIKNYVSTVDTAFLDNTKVKIPKEILKQINCDNYVVFVPNLLIWHYAYKNRISKDVVIKFYKRIILEIIEQYPNHKIVMLPQTFNYKDKIDNDFNFFMELKDNVNLQQIVVIPDTFSSDVQQSVIAKAACMIGARYHSVVFAINQNIPFVALSYEHKISGLLETLKKQDCMIDIVHALDDEDAIEATLCEFKNKIRLVKSDWNACQTAKSIAGQCMDKLVQYLNTKCTNA